MLYSNYTEILTGIKDAIFINFENLDNHLIIEIKMEQRIHNCPVCNTRTSKVHDYRTQYVKDVPMFDRHVLLKLHKRRHVCPSCGKRFYENVSFLPKFHRTTNRLWAFVLSELSKVQSMKDVSIRANISANTVARILDKTNYGMRDLPACLSIDEFRGNSGGKKFQCILTNPAKKKVLDILPERSSEAIIGYFSKFENRSNVKYVCMDMSTLFKSIVSVCFPNAEIVADKFHVLRLVIWAFEDIRKDVQKQFSKHRRIYFKRSKSLLLKNMDELTEDQFEQVSHMLEVSKRLAQAYYLMQEFRKVLSSKNVEEAKINLSNWYMHVGVTDENDFKRFHACVDTFTTWQHEILNAFSTGLSNGYTEGCNNKIKVIKRTAYGFRNFKHFRKRILHIMAA